MNYLPNSVEELELRGLFNLELNNLPASIKKIIFNEYSKYDIELNCLPSFVEYLQLPKKILQFPMNLKTINCSKNYKFLSDLSNYNVEYYN